MYPPKIYFPTLIIVTVGPLPSHREWNVLAAQPSTDARQHSFQAEFTLRATGDSQPLKVFKWFMLFPTITESSKYEQISTTIKNSPHVRKSETGLDYGFQAVDSGFPALDSRLGQWNLDSGLQSLDGIQIYWAVFRISMHTIPESKTQNFLNFGFSKQKFLGFRNPDAFSWSEA